ncbi:MAG: hypothetical protein IT179_07940 [Acidobacteria bacterium]|nr:hypothetical protein [Acidobacteriota bacterium]
MTSSARARACRWLLALAILAVAWAIAIAATGGFVLRLGGVRLSSRRWQAAALVALVSAVAAWAASTPAERSAAYRRVRDWRHWPWWLDAAFLIALAGIGLRLALWSAGRPLWLDEEMIAINVRGRGFTGLGGALWLGQTAPLGWLLLERGFFVLFGGGELALRAAPLAFGIGTIATALWVGDRWMNRLGAAVLAGLCAFGPWLIYNSVELKPYSADAFWGFLLPVLAAWALDPCASNPRASNPRASNPRASNPRASNLRASNLRAPNLRASNPRASNPRASNLRASNPRATLWWLAASAGHWFANGALLVTPACALVIGLVTLSRHGWTAAVRVAAPGVVWLASFGLHYVLSIREALGSEFLAGYWAFAMPPASAGVMERVAWLGSRFESLAVNPAGSRRWTPFWLLAAGGFALTSRPALGMLLAAVPLSAFALAALRIVPLFERLSIWVLPALYLGMALLASRAFEAMASAAADRRWARSGAGVVAIAAALWVSTDIVREGAAYLRVDLQRYARDDNHQLDDRAAVRWLLERRRPGDVIVTTPLALPAIWWYADAPMGEGTGDGSRLADGTPILVTGFAPAQVECGGYELRTPLARHQRALVYLGFRFDDVPKDFDERLLAALGGLGPVVADERFSAAGRAVIVDLTNAGASLRSADAPSSLPKGCLTVDEARRW